MCMQEESKEEVFPLSYGNTSPETCSWVHGHTVTYVYTPIQVRHCIDITAPAFCYRAQSQKLFLCLYYVIKAGEINADVQSLHAGTPELPREWLSTFDLFMLFLY